MAIDDTRLRDLLEQSHDLHSDAMTTSHVRARRARRARPRRTTRGRRRLLAAIPVDDVHRRNTLLGGLPKTGVLAAAGLGTAMVALLASPAFADKAMDVQMLQTAASIENLAVATYDTALTLDFIGGGSANAVVKAFVQKTKEQHQQHAEAFNAAATRLGGKAQDQPDPVLLDVVNNAKPSLTGPAEVVDARHRARGRRRADVRRQHRCATPTRTPARSPPASWASRRSTSRSSCAVQALVAAGAADLIALPPDAAKLPAAAGSVGFPNAFYPTDGRPSRERRSSAVRRRNRKQDPMAISEAELARMTRDLDDAHHDTLPVDAGQPRRVERLGRRHPERHHAAGVDAVEPPGVPARWRRGARWRRARRQRRRQRPRGGGDPHVGGGARGAPVRS